MNSINIIGRLTQDPSTRSAGETQITDLRVAIQRRKAADGSDRGAVYIDVTAFNGLAKICGEYLKKGRQVAVQGRLELDEWKAEDGSPRRRHKVIAEQVEFLDSPKRESEKPDSDVEPKPEATKPAGKARAKAAA